MKYLGEHLPQLLIISSLLILFIDLKYYPLNRLRLVFLAVSCLFTGVLIEAELVSKSITNSVFLFIAIFFSIICLSMLLNKLIK